MAEMELGYWEPRGVCYPIELLAVYMNVKFKRTFPKTPEEWFARKEGKTDGLEFPNLPYIKDEGFTLTESRALPIYLVGKAGRPEMLGQQDYKTAASVTQIIETTKEVNDDIDTMIFFGGSSDIEDCKKKIGEKLVKHKLKIDGLAARAAKGGWLVGDAFTYADIFSHYNTRYFLDLFKLLELEVPSNFAPLAALSERVAEQPGIKEFLADDTRPWNPPGVLHGLTL